MLDVNAGFVHNTLALQNLITTEYNEEDVTIAAIINGEISTSFPTTQSDYITSVTCETNNSPSNASGIATWNGTKWVLSITGVDTGKTICNVEFYTPLKYKILSQGGGIAAIEAKGTPDFSVINGTSGLYAADDEYGKSYYYRGEKTLLNNNLIWGGFQWKIVRINGDGSIRLIYNGIEDDFDTTGTVNDSGASIQTNPVAWNTSYKNDAKYVGYMYGGDNGVASTSREGAVLNETSTNIKIIIDTCYQTNILGKSIESQVVNNLFCNDRQTNDSGWGISEAEYAANHRLDSNKTPTLKCTQKNDRFTTSANTTIGNGALTYPIGLLTADEAAMAGLVYPVDNATNYLYTSQEWWLLSPFSMYGSNYYAYVLCVSSSGGLGDFSVIYTEMVRPVISITPETKVTGTGTSTDPYVAVAS